jgi:hypothetical protein
MVKFSSSLACSISPCLRYFLAFLIERPAEGGPAAFEEDFLAPDFFLDLLTILSLW